MELERENMLSTPRHKLLDAQDIDLRVQLEENASSAGMPTNASSVSLCHSEAPKPSASHWWECETTLADEIGATLKELEECGKKTATQMPNKRSALLDSAEASSSKAEVLDPFDNREQALFAELEDLKHQTAEMDSLIDNIRRWREVRRQESALLELRLLEQQKVQKEAVMLAIHNDNPRDDIKESVETVSERTAESLEMARTKRIRLTHMLEGSLGGADQKEMQRRQPQQVRSPVADVILSETISEIASLENGLAALREVLKRDAQGTTGINDSFTDGVGLQRYSVVR